MKLLDAAKATKDIFEYHDKTEDDKGRVIREAFVSFKSGVITENNPYYVAIRDVIRDAETDEDTAYKFAVEAIDAIIEMLEEKEGREDNGELEDYELIDPYAEAPIYNNELLDWVAKGTSNLAWTEDAINNFGWDGVGKNLITAIQYGYSDCWKSEYFKVLEALNTL